MDITFIEPHDGDVVVVRAARPVTEQPGTGERCYAVIEWGAFELVSERLTSLPKDDAVLEARHCASSRGRDAWDSTGKQMVRLPRLPLVYRGAADTYAVSIDVTDYAGEKPTLAWKSASHLTESEALSLVVANDVSLTIAKALLGKAQMPLACS